MGGAKEETDTGTQQPALPGAFTAPQPVLWDIHVSISAKARTILYHNGLFSPQMSSLPSCKPPERKFLAPNTVPEAYQALNNGLSGW